VSFIYLRQQKKFDTKFTAESHETATLFFRRAGNKNERFVGRFSVSGRHGGQGPWTHP